MGWIHGLGAVLAIGAEPGKLPPAATRSVDFEKDIRPLFAMHCQECHDERKQKSGYRLDIREVALRGGESGQAAIIPRNSAGSRLIQLVGGLVPDLVMPEKGPRLSADEIGLLRAWIDQGAAWPAHLSGQIRGRDHWAFRSPTRPVLPAATSNTPTDSTNHPIDRFIRHRLKQEPLTPSVTADRVTGLRRLSLDLIGLPPTPKEVDDFIADSAPDAYERQVERLLASPHYGERWARHWLDAARFADSNGYEKDRPREMWYYRDWLIQAFQKDLPYDQFLIEQFAGDLLTNATQDQIVATGFLRNSMINEEGAIDPEQFRMDGMFDRLDCIGKSVLGITIQCAQCHTHKYDPLSQEEYYRLFAFLNDDDELTTAAYTLEERTTIEGIHRQIAEIESEWQRQHPDWETRVQRWEQDRPPDTTEWHELEPYEYGDPGGLSKLTLQRDRSLLAGGHRFSGGTWRVKVRNVLTNVAAVRLEVLTNGNLPMHGPGRSRDGSFALREFRLKIAPVNQPTNQTTLKFERTSADISAAQRPEGDVVKDKDFAGPIGFAIDGNEKTSWSIDLGPGRRNAARKAVFNLSTNAGFAEGTEWTFELMQHDEVGCFRLSVTSATNAVVDPTPDTVRQILRTPANERSKAQQRQIFQWWSQSQPDFAEVRSRIEALWRGYPEFKTTALVLHSRTEPRDTRILKRGDWLKPTTSVTPGVPAFLNPMPEGTPRNRLGFARWLADKQAPTTARVFVNRVWQSFFGNGLVTTPEDFGVQGERPSHPELLDWLSYEFMNPTPLTSGPRAGKAVEPWSIQHLMRLIATSDTYRQSSLITAAQYEKDPYNRWLARGPRFRVEGELVRDITLAASGLLNPAIGGPSLYAPAPAFLFEPPTSYSPFPWKDVTGADRYRRAFYTFRRRSTPYPMLQTFDTPNGDAACVRRLRSNTPLQALTSLNETLFVESAQALARRALSEGGRSDPDRITHAFRCVLSRHPTERERARLLDLLQRQKQYIAEGWVNALDLSTGRNEVPANLPEGVTPAQFAAYTVVSRVLLNLDETITKE